MHQQPSDEELANFITWLLKCGGEELAPLDNYEVRRLIIRGRMASIYVARDGTMIWPRSLQNLHKIWRDGGETPKLGQPVRKLSGDRKARMIQLGKRDGWTCFYCGALLQPVDSGTFIYEGALPATLEEICPRQIGGPKHLGNQCLACRPCNAEAGNWPVVKKFAFRERKRAERRDHTSTETQGGCVAAQGGAPSVGNFAGGIDDEGDVAVAAATADTLSLAEDSGKPS